jgi:hypothetical protein
MDEALSAIFAIQGPSELWATCRSLRAESLGEDPDEALRQLAAQYPGEAGPLMVLARRMVQRGEEFMASGLLKRLDEAGCAEASYYRGVAAMRAGQFRAALRHMRRSLALNPNHLQTAQQVEGLQALIESRKGSA